MNKSIFLQVPQQQQVRQQAPQQQQHGQQQQVRQQAPQQQQQVRQQAPQQQQQGQQQPRAAHNHNHGGQPQVLHKDIKHEAE